MKLSKEEHAALALGPKYCVYEESNLEGFHTNMEISFMKVKWDKMNDSEKEPFIEAAKMKSRKWRQEPGLSLLERR